MAKAFIRFLSKSYSLIADVTIETEIIPRVGEIIDARQFLELPGGETGTFITESVVYTLTKAGFTPQIRAHQSRKGIRSHLLQTRGWLLPEIPDMLAYDDDDFSAPNSIESK